MDGEFAENFSQPAIELARDTMRGQLRDLVLDHMMHERKSTLPWSLWAEPEQQALIDRVDQSVGNAIARAVQILAADGKQFILANIEQVTVKDGLKIVLKASRTEANLLLAGNGVAGAVLITFADDDAYQGGQERKPEPLQPDLDLNGGDGEGGVQGAVFDNTASGEGDAPEDEGKRRKKK